MTTIMGIIIFIALIEFAFIAALIIYSLKASRREDSLNARIGSLDFSLSDQKVKTFEACTTIQGLKIQVSQMELDTEELTLLRNEKRILTQYLFNKGINPLTLGVSSSDKPFEKNPLMN